MDNYREEKNNNDIESSVLKKLSGINLNTDNLDQHFLVSSEIINCLVDAAGLTEEDVVMEIGPGPGQITEKIAKRAGLVYGIELDNRFRSLLEEVVKKNSNVHIVFNSALDIKWPLVNKMIMNPPFSILEPLIEKIISEPKIEKVSIVIGKNFCDRCFSSNLSSRTAFLVNAYFKCTKIMEISRDSFFPKSREKAVVMLLERLNKNNTSSDLKFIADCILKIQDCSVRFIFQNLLSKKFKNKNKQGILPYISLDVLEIPERTMKKRIRKLTNEDFGYIHEGISRLMKIENSYKFKK